MVGKSVWKRCVGLHKKWSQFKHVKQTHNENQAEKKGSGWAGEQEF